jgi:3-hydroxyacyl-CoA dehydrogenase
MPAALYRPGKNYRRICTPSPDDHDDEHTTTFQGTGPATKLHAKKKTQLGSRAQPLDRWGGYPPYVLTSMGFAMGPFSVEDLSGLDIAWRMRKAQAGNRDPRERHVDILDSLCEQGRLGRETGAGCYTYANGKKAQRSNEAVRQIIDAASKRRDIERCNLSVEEIRRHALLSMVNEAALLQAERIAVRASDIDVVLEQGYGFPRWEGGHGFIRADLSSLLDH